MATNAHRSSAKLLALSAAAISSGAAAARLLAPPLLSFATWGVPRAYAVACSWLTPPYLYVVLNGIIITIAASSRFQKGGNDGGRPIEIEEITRSEHPEMRKEEEGVAAFDDVNPEIEKKMLPPPEEKPAGIAKEDAIEIEEKAKVIGRLESGEMPVDISNLPTVSARFGGRRIAKSSSEVNPLGVARSRRSDTLESTWRMITDGRSVPLTRHLKKSETWETHNAKAKASERRLPSEVMSERRAPLRREPSLGQEELNRRVESFIQKFNEDMRIQRQESLQRYWDLVNGRK